MRKQVVVAFSLLVLGTAAMAQKIDTKWHCPKPTAVQQYEVGDMPDHNYVIQQGSCEAISSKTGEKSGTFTEFHETWKGSFTFHGRYNAKMDNGDMVYYTYEGSVSMEPKKPVSNKWKIVSGTGKHKGEKGTGSCAGKANDDGSFDWTCTGTVMMAPAKK
jgi:hypothetical protein